MNLAYVDQVVIKVPEPTKEKISYHLVNKKQLNRNALPELIPMQEIILKP